MVVGITMQPSNDVIVEWEEDLLTIPKSQLRSIPSKTAKEADLLTLLKSTIILNPWTQRIKDFLDSLPNQIFRKRVFRLMQAITHLLGYDLNYLSVPEYVDNIYESAKEIKQHLLATLCTTKLSAHLLIEDEEEGNHYDDVLEHYVLHLYFAIYIIDTTKNPRLQIEYVEQERIIDSLEEEKTQAELEVRDRCIEQLRTRIDEVCLQLETAKHSHAEYSRERLEEHQLLEQARQSLQKELDKLKTDHEQLGADSKSLADLIVAKDKMIEQLKSDIDKLNKELNAEKDSNETIKQA